MINIFDIDIAEEYGGLHIIILKEKYYGGK